MKAFVETLLFFSRLYIIQLVKSVLIFLSLQLFLSHYIVVRLPNTSQNMCIDPSNHVDPETVLKEFTNEISPKSLTLERVVEEGVRANI